MIPGILIIRQSKWVICVKKDSYIQNNHEINANPVNILHCIQLMYYILMHKYFIGSGKNTIESRSEKAREYFET